LKGDGSTGSSDRRGAGHGTGGARHAEGVEQVASKGDGFLIRPMNRRTALKRATGAAAAMYATGLVGKSYRRARAQDDIRTQILQIPGAGGSPTEQDMQRVGELTLNTSRVAQGAYSGQKLTFLGLNNAGLHNLVFRPLSRAWSEHTGCEIEWIDLPQAEVFGRVQQSIASGTLDFDLLEGGAPWEGDILGQGLASAMPDWVKEQIDMTDYVTSLQAPVGTWDGVTYRVSIDGDAHNFNYRSDVFASEDLAAEWTAGGGEGEWGVPTTWQQVKAVSAFMDGKEHEGNPLYGILDVCAPWGGFGFYFFLSRASAYAKHPEDKAWLFDAADMKPRINNPAYLRALQDIVETLPFEPPDQVNGDGNRTWLEQFLPGIGSMCHWWGDLGSNVYTNDLSVVQDKVGFSILPGSPDVYNSATGSWDTIPDNNFAPNNAYIGWGLYVMKRAEEGGVSEAAWDLAAHLGGKDISLWTAVYPSGFQPYRNSHFNAEEWAVIGQPVDFIQAYLDSESGSYNHPNAAVEPRIPGIFQYYVAAEIELAKAFAGEVEPQAALDAAAAEWEKITDQIGRESQIQLYQAALG
jgi:multiple sugar transport system substrate-binding protein